MEAAFLEQELIPRLKSRGIGVWYSPEAIQTADRWEHAISADVEEKLVALLGDPGTCPHGNPIPGSANRADVSDHVLLSDASPGPVTVVRISEKIELDDDALGLLAGAQLIPGHDVQIVHVGASGVTVTTPTGDQLVPSAVAHLMWVTTASGPRGD